jgi:hypothetical protein
MMVRISQTLLGAAVFAAVGLFGAAPSQAQTAIQQCSAKYQAAKTANTLNGQTWNQFRSQCQAELRAQPAAATTPAPATTANPLRPTTAAAPASTSAKPTTAAAPAGPATYPSAVDPKYSTLKPLPARMKTCGDAWKANKAANTTGGMVWNKKGGGGYMSECNNRLKG